MSPSETPIARMAPLAAPPRGRDWSSFPSRSLEQSPSEAISRQAEQTLRPSPMKIDDADVARRLERARLARETLQTLQSSGDAERLICQLKAARLQCDRYACRQANVPSGAVLTMLAHLDGEILAADNQLVTMLGFFSTHVELQLLHWDKLASVDDHQADQHARAQLRNTGICDPWMRQFLRRDGGQTTVSMTAARQNESGACLFAVLPHDACTPG